MAKTTAPDIPNTENCVLAVNIDINRKIETILIGERSEVKKYLDGIKDCDLIYMVKRDVGLLLSDFTSDPIEIADIKTILLDSTGRNEHRNLSWAVDRLTEYISSENPILAFTAILMWQEYRRALSTKDSDNLLDIFDDITLPLRLNVLETVKRWQGIDKHKPLMFMDTDFRKYPVQIYYDYSDETKEYGITDISTSSLLIYYLKQIYEGGRYIQTCPLCGNPFIAKTANRKTYCSPPCKRESQRLNKREFDERARDTSYEQAHKNGYMYWYNKIVRLKEKNPPKDLIKKIEDEFDEYNREASKRKWAVKKDKKDPAEYEDWLITKRIDIDKMMEEMKKYE